jgi:purine catabolism regulator
MHGEKIASSRVLLNTDEAQPLQAYAGAVLGPLDATDPSGELLRGLIAFLEHDGHWGSAAIALRVYRHTMRNRIEAVERLTGRRMDSAQDRHELWLPLRARDAAQTSAD